jgi:hypothetical protein
MFFVGVLKVKRAGPGTGTESFSQQGADLDPYQNVTDPQHCSRFFIMSIFSFFTYDNIFKNFTECLNELCARYVTIFEH